jgi:hypothetical protein
MTNKSELIEHRKTPLAIPADIDTESVRDISEALKVLLADVFVLHLKTTNSNGCGRLRSYL